MIKINLLGNSTAIDNSGRLVFVGAIAATFFTLVLFVLLVAQLASKSSSLALEAKTLEGKLENLMQKTKSVTELEGKKKILQSKLAVIAELKKGTVGPVRVLDDLNIAVGDKVWLAEVTESGSEMKLRGRALTNQDIANFIKKLEDSDYFDDVNLVESRSMYYDKRSGEIKAGQDLSSLGGGTDSIGGSKVNREVGGSIVGQDTIKDDINIKEFIISAKIKYTGVYQSVKAEPAAPPAAPAPKPAAKENM